MINKEGSSPKKKAILLAYYFPPRLGIGSLRASYLAKYLPEFGWEITVVTAKFSSGSAPAWSRTIETGYTDVLERAKRLIRVPSGTSTHDHFGVTPPKFDRKMNPKQRVIMAAAELIAFPDAHVGWSKPAADTVSTLLNEDKYDAIISTSYPYTAHLVANRICRQHKIPWVADLRDAWRGFHYHLSPNPIVIGMHAMLERLTLRRASAITTVSKPLEDLIAKNNPGVPTFNIPNSFDPEEWHDVPFRRPAKLTLTYAGSLGHHRPEPLFQALSEEFGNGTLPRGEVEFTFYGRKDYWLDHAIEQYGLADIVRHNGFVDRATVLKAERATTANILLLWDDPRECGMYTGKFFEYLGAGRPILVIGGPEQSVVKDAIAQTGGWYTRSVPEIRQALRELYGMHLNHTELGPCYEAQQFSAPLMAKSFAGVLDKLLSAS